MKLPERFRADRADDALDPEVEAQLAVIDTALAGGPVPEDGAELAQLARELHAERAEPDPTFAAELDRWAASGFARGERPGAGAARGAGALERLRSRVTAVPPRRLIAPVGAAATLVVVVGVAISQSGIYGVEDQGGGGAVPQAVPAGEGNFEAVSPGSDTALRRLESGDAAQTSSGAEAAGAAPPQELAVQDEAAVAKEVSPDTRDALGFNNAQRASGAASPGPNQRKVAQTADLVLAAEPEGVREVADGVNEVVNRYRGIVVSSSVQSGDARGGLGSQFRLRIPATNLQAALADLSELAHVQSRTESLEDITGRFISAQERIEENEASRDSLLIQLAAAETETEADAIRTQLRIVNSQLSAARAELADVRQRVQLVPVTVSIVAEEGASDDGQWGIDEAIDDAGKVLSAAAGIAVVAGAVLLPLALIGLIVALIMRTRVHRGRERALDE